MDNIKNVIVICDFAYTKGGSEKVAIESSVGLASRGINVVYFCASGPIDERLRHKNIRVINLEQKSIVENSNKIRAIIQGVWNFKAKSNLERILEEYSPDDTIVHLHLWQKALSGSIIKAINKKGFKSVFTMHHYFMACPNGGFFNYKKNKICDHKCMGIKCILTDCDSRNYFYKVWRVVRLFIERNIALSTKTIRNYFYISNLGKNALVPYLNENSKYYYIPNPIDIKKASLQKIGKNKYYVYIGRLSREKGVHLLATVAKKLNLNIVFVGDGDCKSDILNIYPNAIVTGWLNKNEVDKYLMNSRALIMPSLWYEGMPLSVMEAQARGIPVIVSDTCAANEIIESDKNGYLFKNNDEYDLEKIITKINDNNLLEKLSAEAYDNFWDKDYSLNAHVNNIIKAYNEILESN